MAESALTRRSGHRVRLPLGGQFDEDVFEAGSGDFDSEHAAEAAEVRHEVEHPAFLFADRDLGRVLRHLDARRVVRRDRGLERARELVKRHRDLVQPAGEQLQRVDVATRGLASRAHDEDVVAQRFRFAENLGREHDRPAARRFPAQPVHDRPLQYGIHARRELVEKDDRRVEHEHLGHLNAPLEAATQIHHLAVGLGAKLELIEHVFGAIADGAWRQPVKSAERAQVVHDRQEQIDGALLDDDRDALSHLERILQRVDAFHLDMPGRGAQQRRQHLQRGRLAGAVRSEQAEDRSPSHRKRQAVDRANVGLAAAFEDLYEVANDDGGIAHGSRVSLPEMAEKSKHSFDHRPAGEKGVVIVIGIGNHEQRPGLVGRLEHAPALCGPVRCDPPRPRSRGLALERGKCVPAFRTGLEAADRPAATGSDAGRPRSSTRTAIATRARPGDVPPQVQRRLPSRAIRRSRPHGSHRRPLAPAARGGRARIEPQAVFSGRSGIAAVPAIIEDKHGQARSRQRIGQCGAVRAVSGVAVEDQDDEFRRGGAADEPAVQRQTVCGRKRHRCDAAESDGVRIGHVRGRKIDELALQRPERGTSIATSTMPDESTSLTASRV